MPAVVSENRPVKSLSQAFVLNRRQKKIGRAGETEASNMLVFDHGNQDLVPRIEALASHRASTPNKLFLILDLCIVHRLQHRSCKRRSLVQWAKARQQRIYIRICVVY
ncbi:hypothetical protein NW765_014639 [Fusarium oxysporum]|nr:hypothetical protein NW765_014639 [Fusarium oxysporum]